MSEAQKTGGALWPFRALDLTDEKGFLCGRMLADFGADVIKIEPPGGDRARRMGPFYHDVAHPEKSLHWFLYNANKRGITLNIESADGREMFKRLAKTADFVIESFPPGYMEGLGLGYEALSEINPRIIVASITPFGQTGPYAAYKGSDLVGWGAAGILYLSGDPDRPPLSPSIPQAYLHAAAEAAVASLIAHWHRERTGEGQHVDVSMQSCITRCILPATPYWDLHKRLLKRQGWSWGTDRVTFGLLFPCKDGYVNVILLGGGATLYAMSSRAIVEWIDEEVGAPSWLRELDWVNEYDSAKVPQDLVDRVEVVITEFLLTKTKAEIYDRAVRRGICAAPVCNAQDLAGSEQLRARDFWVDVEHPDLGDTITYPGAYLKATETPWKIRRCAPLIGQHNSEIYEADLGITKEQLVLLTQAGVI